MALATCPKCGGSGRIPSYLHVAEGLCFRCNGSGKAPVSSAPRCLNPLPEEDYDGGSISTDYSELQAWLDAEAESDWTDAERAEIEGWPS